MQEKSQTGSRVSDETLWQEFLAGLNEFTDDFFEEGRDQGIQSPRESME